VTRYTLRDESAADLPLVNAMYRETREAELAATGWPAEQCRAFLDQQAAAQRRHYRTHYPGASFQLIEVQGRVAGRLYLHETDDDLRIMDIIIMPAWRRHGLATEILRSIQARAQERGTGASIHVEKNNSALRLYERLGFRVADDVGVYWLMRWRGD
jgi:ribosomal protein S18 acetylase RimI-like enzyme